MGSPQDQARDVRDRLKVWLLDRAYPLWANAGCDPEGGFFEKIGQDGAPTNDNRRIRVAARQTYAFALAGELGWSGDWRGVVRHGLDALSRYRREDGLYAILTAPGGEVLDDTPAPYEQAFAMLALSAAQQALGEPFEANAVETREALKRRFGRPDGGFNDIAPPLRANPHMHLLEAALAWRDVGADPGWGTMARGVAGVALERMVEPDTGALCELFDDDWRPLPDADVEPGHQLEWGWLLMRSGHGGGTGVGLRLIGLGEARGVDADRGVAFNALDRALNPRDLSARLWPQTERLKAAVAAAAIQPESWASVAPAAKGLLKYLGTPVKGLWWDRMEADGRLVDEAAPASSFYHIVGAILDLDRAVQRLS